MPYMRINGVDITRYIRYDGFKLSENDLDSSKAGRTLDALMHRGKVAQKDKAEITLVPIKQSVANWIIPLLRNEYVTVDTDLFPGGPKTMEMYCSSRKYDVPHVDSENNVWYQNLAFNVIQR